MGSLALDPAMQRPLAQTFGETVASGRGVRSAGPGYDPVRRARRQRLKSPRSEGNTLRARGIEVCVTTEATFDLDTSLHPLDDPVRASLRGEHRRFASWVGRIGRYDPQVARFVGHPPVLEEQDWADLATVLGPGGMTGLRGDGHRRSACTKHWVSPCVSGRY